MTTPIRKKALATKTNQTDLFIETDTPAICRLWALRLLTSQKLLRKLYMDDELDPEFANTLGLTPQAHLLSATQLQRALVNKQLQLELQAELCLPEPLARNIQSLAQMMGLTALEQQLLGFVALVKTDRMLNSTAVLLRDIKKQQLPKILAQILGCNEVELQPLLRQNSTLINSGLLALESMPVFSLDDVFEFISVSFAYNLFDESNDVKRLLKEIVQQASPATLTLKQFQHIETDLQILLPYLKNAVEQQLPGVNVLIYGPPGTGKSELVRALAKKLTLPLFEVSSEDSEGDGISGNNRLRAYRMVQCLLSSSKNIVLFDEIEDVFAQNPFSRQAELRKGWMNRMLEQNTLPCFWVTNDHTVMDNAFIRRFDQVIALASPPQAQRAALLQDAAAKLVNAEEAMQLAALPQLTPAIITRASKVVAQLNPKLTRPVKVAALKHLMQQTLRAQGHQVDVALTRDALGPVYDASLVNADIDLLELTKGLINAGSGRLCLYGPPGTGKTAFCHFLAKQLGKPLLQKTAGQLFGMYVGQTEKQIAAAFAEAKQQDAVLLLDEVDSFLQDRRGARQQWQVSAVNEMLMQMEAFAGVFVASTNLLDNLDQASLRRFDLKAGFSYLKPEQTKQLFDAHCQQLQLSPCRHSAQRLAASSQLTPGDFAAVARQSRFRSFATAAQFAAALLNDVKLKSLDTAKPIGFLQ
ncbi:ATP-binding protein [Rheinheimera sp. UJ51]|uniref:AAA family ATPase n=1 Tax=Rheinheimera sp. UJ51 TaxID=2892446 RepID=UPI001E292033|nr:ATP-binding protein [Rheinheimera sp. UJ51]MCC5451806.1 ATP-binding protein [Rheinheimera sp. UJ51]